MTAIDGPSRVSSTWPLPLIRFDRGRITDIGSPVRAPKIEAESALINLSLAATTLKDNRHLARSGGTGRTIAEVADDHAMRGWSVRLIYVNVVSSDPSFAFLCFHF